VTNPFGSGKAAKGTGIMLLLLGVLASFVLRFMPDVPLALGFLPALMIVAGGFIFFRSRQYAAKSSAESILYGGKQNVLYLRPFTTDASVSGQSLSTLVGPIPTRGMATEEEQLAEVLRPFGELVAIGQPGESLPRPGAARLYATHDEWQRTVVERMQTSRLVVIRAGSGPGVMWELQKAREIIEPRKLLVFVLRMRRKSYKLFRQEAEKLLGVRLPALPWKWPTGRSGFFRFSHDWTPELLPLSGPRLRGSVYKPLRSPMQFALRPVFAIYGLEWVRPPISKIVATSYAVLGLFGLIFVGLIVASVF
jgi:hypothetical protein